MVCFKISSGEIYIDQACVGHGYAGQPPHVNDATATALKGIGPLPVGLYAIEAPQDRHQSVGAYALALVPHPDNEMHGRGDFYFHGPNPSKDVNGAQLSSDGCPVTDRATREAIWADEDHTLAVIA